MRQILNTLYVMTQGAYVHVDHETLRVDVEGKTQLQVPVHHLGAVVGFGNVLFSPFCIHRCAEDGRSIVLLDSNGRFKARVEGPVSGNVLLRKAQYDACEDSVKPLAVARNIVAAKIQNSRQVILRGGREAVSEQDASEIDSAGDALAKSLAGLPTMADLDQVRGCEGEAARTYFGVLDRLVREDREAFKMNGRNRRPPLDRINALLSFLYALLLGDCVSGAEGVGLDPQMGFLHTLRPGRPALGLDLMEELRAVLADRLALTLINRKQVTAGDFEKRPGGAVLLSEKGRKEVVVSYQKRKQDEIQHFVLDQKIPFGLVPHVQARLMARYLRGDLAEYPPFLYRG